MSQDKKQYVYRLMKAECSCGSAVSESARGPWNYIFYRRSAADECK